MVVGKIPNGLPDFYIFKEELVPFIRHKSMSVTIKHKAQKKVTLAKVITKGWSACVINSIWVFITQQEFSEDLIFFYIKEMGKGDWKWLKNI